MSDQISCFAQPSFAEGLHCVVNAINAPMWTWLVWILIGVGTFFTLATGFVQIRLFARSISSMFNSRSTADNPEAISSFQAFVTGLASRVGTGNIAGVAIAISLGGPGAVFWMWLTALIGMSSAFAESTLAQLFKIRDPQTGEFRGGPAYYIERGLGQKWLGILFALSLLLCFGFVYNAIQSNTITLAIQSAAGLTDNDNWENYKYVIGAGLIILTAPIIFGGMKRVARISEAVVPMMAVIYLLMALYIVATNISEVPRMFALIFNDAFTFNAAGGGLLGGMISQAMMLGIKRGLYSNEAGQGSAPNAAAAADVKHPVTQGMVQMLGVFVDTIIVCSCTAFIVLLADLPANDKLSGIQLTQAALESHVGAWGQQFLAIILFVFAFTTIIGNYAYAEANIQFLKNNRTVLTLFRMVVLAFVFFGAVSESPLVWDMGDMTMGFMALINLLAIVLMYRLVNLLLKDYTSKIKMGKEPVFKLSEHPVLKRKIKSDVW